MAIKIGIFGLGRGHTFVKSILASGGEVVAICDRRPSAPVWVKDKFPEIADAAVYDNFDEFIKHDMDAVLLANYFNEHCDFAIKAMENGKHVLSECTSNVTMGDGVRLCRAVEKTGMTYALLENYPYFKENLEMARVFKEGTLGKLVYAEGEYSHPMSTAEQNALAPGRRHWRNWTPRSYYLTHAIAPLMKMTDAMPTRVTAMASFAPEIAKGTALRTGDAACIVMCQTDTDAVFRVIGWAGYAPHGNWYKLCCTKGGMETNHSNNRMRLIYNDWCRPEGVENTVTEYDLSWPDEELGKIADNAGHGGGDFWVVYDFIKCLENKTEPYFNVYRATAMASVAILGWRSVLNGNMAYDIPDFRKEEDKRKYENDFITCYPDENYHVNIPCCSNPYAPTEEDLASADEAWKNAEFLLQ